MRIFASFLGEGISNNSGVVEKRQFSVISLAITCTSVTLEMRPALFIIQRYAVYHQLFSELTQKCMTLIDLQWLFHVKFCFRASLFGFSSLTFENNCVKTNEDRHILPAAEIFGSDSSFWQYKVSALRGYSHGFSRKESSKDRQSINRSTYLQKQAAVRQQSIELATHRQWDGRFTLDIWGSFGSKIRYVWHFLARITWQPAEHVSRSIRSRSVWYRYSVGLFL